MVYYSIVVSHKSNMVVATTGPPPPMLIPESPLPTGSFVEGIAGLARFITTYLQAITCVPRTPPTASVKINAMSSGQDQPIGFGIPLTRKTSASPRCPRLLPWIMVLIRHLAGKGKDPTGIYWELWCRDMGQGIIQINDEQECAYASGYTSSRALRTWREHVQLLVDLHFLKVERNGNREVGYVLLLNPLKIARWYHERNKAPRRLVDVVRQAVRTTSRPISHSRSIPRL